MKTRPTRIQLKGEGTHEEGRAAGAILPGNLITLDANGALIRHNLSGGWAEKAIALEDALQGNGITVAYASGDLVSYVIPKPGDVVFVLLNGGENADPSKFLASAGDGTFKVASGSDVRLLKPLEALNLTDSGDVDTHIRARVL